MPRLRGGGEAAFIDGLARLTRHHGVWCVMMPRESYRCHAAILSATQPPSESSSIFTRVLFSDLIFEGDFGGLLVL